MTASAIDVARALELARSASNRSDQAIATADKAHRIAFDALDGQRATYEEIGKMAREVAGVKGALGKLADQTQQAIQELRKAARNSHATITEVKEDLEDTKVRNLRSDLEKAEKRIAQLQRKKDKWFWWWMGIAAAVIAATVIATIASKK